MRLRWPRLVFGVSTFSALAVVIACSSKDPLPPPGAEPDGGGYVTGSTSTDASTSRDAGSDAADAAFEAPKSCSNTVRDGKESDVDCGGTECLPCIDGKECVADTDCAGGSCANKKCTTPACNDVVSNGEESDVDCGGSVCAKCTTGKKCLAASDCLSGNCVNQACACPAGMAIVAKAGGGAYCIDQVEVTKGQYNKFLTANLPVTDQIDLCKAPVNATFVPRGAWPPAVSPPGGGNGLGYNLSLPVHYVDWCDAYAYCKWANKQLCGRIDGGSVAPGQANDASESAWYNACSAQGQKAWPYSTVFDGTKCNGKLAPYDAGVPTSTGGYGFGNANQDEGVYAVVQSDNAGNFTQFANDGCQGGSVGVYQMSGNVAEWEDSCDGAGASANCKLRGGSYGASNDPPTLSCAADRSEVRMPPAPMGGERDVLEDVGFRCCLF